MWILQINLEPMFNHDKARHCVCYASREGNWVASSWADGYGIHISKSLPLGQSLEALVECLNKIDFFNLNSTTSWHRFHNVNNHVSIPCGLL